MAKTVDLGVIAERLKGVQDKLAGEDFKGSAEIVDNHVVLRGEVAGGGDRPEAHSEVVPMVQVFLLDKDVLGEAFTRLQRWAAEVQARPAAA